MTAVKEIVSKIVSKYKVDKKPFIIMSIGILIMLMLICSEFTMFTEENENNYVTENEGYHYVENEEIEKFLENITGAGDVKIMITYDTSVEYIYACDTSEKSDTSNETDKEINYKSEHIIIKDDDGEKGLEIKEIYPKIRGVAVICEGGNNPVIKGQIISIISALFDINTNRISVAAKGS